MEQEEYDRLLTEGAKLIEQLNNWYSKLRALRPETQPIKPNREQQKEDNKEDVFVSDSNQGLSSFVPLTPDKSVRVNHIEGKQEGSPFTATRPTATTNSENIAQKLSVIDYFHLKRELFADDTEEMNRVLNELSALNNADDATKYITDVLRWNIEDDSVAHLVETLRNQFSGK